MESKKLDLEETPAERVHRLTEQLRGLLKDEIAQYGSAEEFIRWVRSDNDEDAACCDVQDLCRDVSADI
jgi:hypothetical protein